LLSFGDVPAAASLQPAADLERLPAAFFGVYRAVERIAAGGMGAIYRGVDMRGGPPVAIKTALTSREADVCAAIIRGVTSEGIALELGVGLNTVLTYKKRAYARLNISSQNQLMRLVLN